MKQLLQLQELQAHMGLLDTWVEVAVQWSEGLEAWGIQWGPRVGMLQVMVERAQQWDKWLTNEAALEQQGVLHELG
ncbi:hypothetical protein C0989_008303 [Termitomyces sp. Mn162]|nr:hypothetical protein C0989_008303 [Termitomyces sp. Mn162]